MMTKLVAFTLLFAVIVNVAQAADLTLADALAGARSHSYSLKKAEAERLAANAGHAAARKNRLPVLSADARAQYQSELAALSIELPGMSLNRELGSKEQYQFDALLSLPIYTGGRISGGIRQAASLSDYQAAIADATVEQLLYATRVAYFSLVRTQQELEAARAGKRRAEVVMQNVTSMYDAGVADSIDLLEVSQTLNRADLRLRQADLEHRQASIELAVLTGRDLDEPLTPRGELAEPSPATESANEITPNKPELRAAEAMIDVHRARLELAAAAYLPDLSIQGGYHYGKPNIDLFENSWNDHFTVGARLSWSFNIGNRAGAERRAARYRLDATVHERDRTKEQLTEAASLAHEQLQLAYDQYAVARDNLSLNRDSYRLSRNKHQQGTLTTNRLLEIEASLSEAEAQLSSALARYYQVQSAYWYATGSEQLTEGI